MATKIGRFEIVTELAKSAASAVYKANDPTAGRTIALKTIRFDLPPDLAQILVGIILREADSTKALNSQNIAALYGAGDVDGQFCAAMEYVEGNSLANMIASQEGFSIWDILDISRQVCSAIDHADSHGILHKGLEPGKVMMQWDGTVKVLGYGISTMVSAMPSKGANVPTLFYYMSPEQVKGDAMDISSNIFSWGAMLYEMVTERKPFTGDDIQTVRQKILEETPEPPATINPRMNLGVSRVIMQALAKNPEERYARGSELLNDLDKAKETSQQKAARESKSPSGLVIPEKLKAPGASSSKFVVPKVSEEDDFVPAPAAKAPATPKATAKLSPKGEVVDGILNAAGEEISAPARKAAAAAAGVGEAASTISRRSSVQGVTQPQTSMSAAAAEPPAAERPKFRTDPMMAEARQGGPKTSFSELDELPPLKESDFAPPPPPLPEPEDVQVTTPSAFTPAVRPAKPERPKVVTRENARRAVKEIKQVPPRLMVYAISAAAAVIVLVLLGIGYRIYNQAPEDETAAPPPAEAVQQEAPAVAEPEPAVTAEEPVEPEVVVKPRYAPKKVKAAPVRPVIIPGEMSITSTPEGAQVQIDGHSNPGWLTPHTLTGLAPGQHSITISKPGFTPETRMIDVGSGSKSVIAVHLTQLGATVALGSEPAGANVYIDGKDTGRVTPVQLLAEKGTHTFLVRKQGYLDETTTVELAPGQNFRYAPVLRVLGVTEDIKTGGGFKKLFGGSSKAGTGKVTVKTKPKGAQITVNRRMVDKAAPVDFYLNPGNYMIDITLSGYKPVHRVINVEEGSKVELNENLEPQ